MGRRLEGIKAIAEEVEKGREGDVVMNIAATHPYL